MCHPVLRAAVAVSALAAAACSGPRAPQVAGVPDVIDFNFHVRPILSESCFRCHGPDAGNRKAGLRLDRKDGATRELESGAIAVVPGDLEASELIARVTADDPSLRMPPPKASSASNTSPSWISSPSA